MHTRLTCEHTRTDIRKRVCRPPSSTLEHLGSTRWATRAQGYTQGRAHAAQGTRAHIPPRGRADTHTQGLQTRIPAPTKIPPHPTPGRIQPYPPQPRAAARPGRGRSHTGPSRVRPASPYPLALGAPPTVLRSFPTIPSGALTCSGVAPGPPVSAPQEGPRAGCAPRAAPAAQLGASCCVSSFWGEGLESGVGGAGGAAASGPRGSWRRPHCGLLRAPLPPGGPSPPRLRGPRRLPRGAVEIHATSPAWRRGAPQPARSGNPRLRRERTAGTGRGRRRLPVWAGKVSLRVQTTSGPF